MNWKDRLSEIEIFFGKHESRNWKPSIDYINMLLAEMPNEMEVSVRSIYILHNILVEEKLNNIEHDNLMVFLKRIFNESYDKFSDNAEYSFFIGKILFIAEWYFGMDDDNKTLEERLSFNMQKKAFEKEPDNRLYEWAYLFSKGEKALAFNLSKELLYDEKKYLGWLQTKGFAGKYLIESLRYCYENCDK